MMSEKLPVVAHCEKCSRDFVWINPECKTDQYPPEGSKRNADGEWLACGGRIIAGPRPA